MINWRECICIRSYDCFKIGKIYKYTIGKTSSRFHYIFNSDEILYKHEFKLYFINLQEYRNKLIKDILDD